MSPRCPRSFCIAIPLLLGLWLAFVHPVHAANSRSQCLNNLRQIIKALHSYRDVYGRFPKDVCDRNGTPLLSWRVALLPFLELDSVYRQFRLDEPWDGPNNSRLAREVPKCYRCPSAVGQEGTTHYLALTDAATIAVRDTAADRTTTVVLIEVNEDRAVVWSKPGDLRCDPVAPADGLARHHGADFGSHRGGFAAFADGTVRFVPVTADSKLLRAVFDADGAGSVRLSLTWFEAFSEPSVRRILVASLCLSLAGIVGGTIAAFRLGSRRPVSPGELLWIVIGMQCLVHLASVMASYRYEPLPTLSPDRTDLWFLPAAAATAASFILLVHCSHILPWRAAFAAACLLFTAVALDSGLPHQHRPAEEAFMTALSPLTLALVGVIATAATLLLAHRSTLAGRRFVHWSGILFCFVPLCWFLFCMSRGLVVPREMFNRIRD